MIETILLLAVVFLSVLYLRNRGAVSPKNYPPGPGWKLPVVGHMLMVGDKPHETMLKWKEEYGPVIAVQLGSFPAVFINNGKLIREAFNENVLSGRPPFKLFKDRSHGVVKGVLFTEGNKWSETRRFIIRNLRDFGLGKASMESIISHEAAELVDRLKGKTDQDISLKNVFNAPVLNALWCIVTGDRFEQDDPHLTKAIDFLVQTSQEDVKAQGAAMLIPWIATYFPSLCGYVKVMKPIKEVLDFISSQLEKVEKSYEEGAQRGFVDVFIEAMRKTDDINSPFHKSNDELRFILTDLWAAGTDTTSTALTWTFLLLAKDQTAQKKVQEEIDSVVGRRHPTLADRDSMPFTNAVMCEVQRFGSVVPLALYHQAMADTSIGGYFIPKDTMVVPNIYGVHHDKSVWGDPENFRPERFLDESGNLAKNDNYMPFSVGKRVCLGESLAKDEFFFFLTHLFQAYTVMIEGEIDTTGGIGIIRSPKDHQYILKKRLVE